MSQTRRVLLPVNSCGGCRTQIPAPETQAKSSILLHLCTQILFSPLRESGASLSLRKAPRRGERTTVDHVYLETNKQKKTNIFCCCRFLAACPALLWGKECINFPLPFPPEHLDLLLFCSYTGTFPPGGFLSYTGGLSGKPPLQHADTGPVMCVGTGGWANTHRCANILHKAGLYVFCISDALTSGGALQMQEGWPLPGTGSFRHSRGLASEYTFHMQTNQFGGAEAAATPLRFTGATVPLP